jgi:hypothetical protein
MKYEKEATTKNGRRTWKVTYELVRGPEPKQKRKEAANSPSRSAGESKPSRPPTAKPAKAEPKKPEPKKPKPAPSKKGKTQGSGKQLGFF